MVLNGIFCKVHKGTITDLGLESIIYCEDINKLMVLNSTALFIWKMLNEAEDCESELDISQITQHILHEYSLADAFQEDIHSDTCRIMKQFEEQGFIERITAER